MLLTNLRDVQVALLSLGFDPGPLDGDLGPKTRDALRRFQAANGLTVDGIFGPSSRGALTAKFATLQNRPVIGQGSPPTASTPAPSVTAPTPPPPAGRPIHMIVVHCTATPWQREYTREQINQMHIDRGFSKIGYHKLFHLDGRVSIGRAESEVGAHVSGFNTGTLGYSYVGGLGPNGEAKDTRTLAQNMALAEHIKEAAMRLRIRSIVGHRDLSPDLDHDGVVEPHEWVKQCPCFNAVPEYGHLLKR